MFRSNSQIHHQSIDSLVLVDGYEEARITLGKVILLR
jgi:hypothetical protein